MTTDASIVLKMKVALKSFFHLVGHLLDMDCAVFIDNETQVMTCKKCGRVVK